MSTPHPAFLDLFEDFVERDLLLHARRIMFPVEVIRFISEVKIEVNGDMIDFFWCIQ